MLDCPGALQTLGYTMIETFDRLAGELALANRADVLPTPWQVEGRVGNPLPRQAVLLN